MKSTLLKFERISAASLAIGLLICLVEPPSSNDVHLSAMRITKIQIFTSLIIFGFVLLTSRQKSKIAKWVLAISFFGGSVLYPVFYLLRLDQPFSHWTSSILSIIQIALQCIAMYFLFFDSQNDDQFSQ